jgi:3-oxoacyl-[acyl-carrier protein] reductase/bacilysin biosynthesis oxidoreductase BacG
MDFRLEGKTAVVTGASQGIGREVARALYSEGIALAIVGRHAATLEEALVHIAAGPDAAGPDAAGPDAAATRGPTQAAPIYLVEADLGLQAEVERAAREAERRLGHIDFLVNNAAQVPSVEFFEMSDRAIEEAVAVKLLGYVRMVHELAPHMKQRGGGAIVNIVGSTARTPTPDFIIGSMINAALINFTRGIARELARHRVRVNSISPGWTMTDRQREVFERQAAARGVSTAVFIQGEARKIPAQHLVEMDEIATLTLLLLSDLIPSMIGEELILDGGLTPSI